MLVRLFVVFSLSKHFSAVHSAVIVCGGNTRLLFKVIPLKLFYYQTFFETWRNEHS